LVEVIDTAGRVIELRRDGTGLIRTLQCRAPTTGEIQVFGQYEYDAEQRLVAFTDPDGYVTRFEYVGTAHLSKIEYPTGLTVHYRYDRQWRCIESWCDYGERPDPALADDLPEYLPGGVTRARGAHHILVEFGEDGYSEVTDSVRTQRYFANERGRLEKAVGNGGVTSRTFDSLGNMTSHTDASEATTHYEWDIRGRLLKQTDALGHSYVVERDIFGRPIKNIDPLGNVVQVQRDGAGNPLVITNQRGHSTSYEYDSRGLMITRYEPNGGVTRFESDDHANLTRMVTPKGGEWRWTWDYFGRVVSKTDPLGNTTQYRYTNSGRIRELVQADGTSIHYTYDGLGNVTSVQDEAGRLTRFEWGGYNWCCRKTLPDGSTIEYRYNREGWLVWVANQLGETCTFEHDHTGLVVRETTFDGRRHRYTYDAMGRLSAFENGAGERTQIERDAVGRVARIVYHDGSEDVFERDANGHVTRVTGADATIEYTYDRAGNVVRESTERRDGGRFTVERQLDALGRWTRLETSLGLRLEAARDVLGDASRISLGGREAVEYERDVLGFPLRRRLPGQGSVETRYDSRFRVTERSVRSSTDEATGRGQPEWLGDRPPGATFWRAYEYNTNDDPVREWGRPEGVVELEYDARSHLLARGDEEFRVDALSRHFPRQETRAYAGGGRITQAGNTTFEWDDAGQLLAKRKRDEDTGAIDEWRYRWNARRLLEAVTLPSGREVRFLYDPFGRRVEKAVYASGTPDATLVSCVTYHWFGNRVLHEVTYDSAAVTPPRERQWAYEDGSLSPFAVRDKTFDVSGVGQPRRAIELSHEQDGSSRSARTTASRRRWSTARGA
jgi:YD repeat-containing protein